MSPARVLVFLVVVLAVLALLGQLIPRDGLAILGLTLRLPRTHDVLFPVEQARVDISDILAVATDSTEAPLDTSAVEAPVDSASKVPAFDPSALAPLEERIKLHFPAQGSAVLQPFFADLESAASQPKPIRILHYGDSQIEGDRITAYVRNKLQAQFGGNGPGLIAVADIVPHFSVERVLGGDWKRYSVMGKKPKEQSHDRFGALSAFSRFSPILHDTFALDTIVHEAFVTLKPERRCYAKAQAWSRCKLWFGWHRAPVTVTVEADGAELASETIGPANELLLREWRLGSSPKELTLRFRGADSPDIFGIALDGRDGVSVDNIAARGAAGYEFKRQDQSLLASMYAQLGPSLLILQYGGNVLPNLKSKEEAEQYGRFFGAQIGRFRKLAPGVPVIVIGPSDMSIKEGEDYVTRPYLEDVRDAMKANTLAQGAVFWDMYDAMGGRNSMVSWVQADPPLAAEDYTHFSPLGARKVGELFYTALINAYADHHAAQQ